MSDLGAASEVGAAEDGLETGTPAAGAAPAATITAPGPAAARPTVSVVVCCFTQDGWEDLARTVRSVLEQTEPAREIIVVADHCPDLLSRAERELPGVTAVPNPLARGPAGARNIGVGLARGDVVAFIDDDAAADPGWIAGLADQYRDSRVKGVGGLVKPVWESGRPRWFPAELDWVVGCSYQGMPAGRQPVRNFIGANMSFRREVLEDLDGFSADLGRAGTVPAGCEETELCLRVSRRYPDGVLLHEPAASVSHRVRGERASWGYLGARCYAEGLSKAKVARLAGARRAVSSERAYVRTAVPRGVGRSLAGAARGQLTGLAAALALVFAVAAAGAGYLVGRAGGQVPGVLSGPPAPREGHIIGRLARSALVPWAGLALSLGLWAAGLAGVDAARVKTASLGLVSVLPATFWAALAVLTVNFCAAVVRRSTRWPVLAAHATALVTILHATPALVYGTLRYSWAWKHIGVVDFIAHHGVQFHLSNVLGVYQGWPGFFALNSFLTSAAGQPSALSYASWALLVNDLLWLGPVLLIARAFTSDQRLVWTAAWLFELGNWVGQDYFSPQAFAFFLYLAVIAVCLRWLRDPESAWRPVTAGPGAGSAGLRLASRSTRRVLVVCLVPLMVAIASSHQLTPFMLISALTVLALAGQLRPRWLPLLMLAITVGWLAYAAWPWLAANTSQILQGFGLPWANTSAHIVGGATGGPGQVIVDWGARLLSAAVVILAFIGYWRYRRHHNARARRSWNRVPLLAASAAPAVAANSYGGEIIFRAFLFALPFLAVAAAAAFFPHPKAGRPVLAGLALAGTGLALVAGFSLGNYGKEAMDYFSPGEVAASDWLYKTAPPGAEVVAATSNFPWAFVHYNWYSYTFLGETAPYISQVPRSPVSTVIRVLKPGRSPASYLVLTKSQAADVQLSGIWPAGTYSRIVHDLMASGRFRVVYSNADAQILQLKPAKVARQSPAPARRCVRGRGCR